MNTSIDTKKSTSIHANTDDILYVGIDGGGTNCRVRIESAAGVLLGIGHGGSANPSHGLLTVIESIMTAITSALVQASLPQESISRLVVGAGLAGLHLPKYRRMMAEWQHPFKALYLTDDLHIATIGAHAGEDGAVAIIGTGFSALSVVGHVQTPIGGYGFLQADHCSGSWIGYQAVQAVLLANDKLAKPTLLRKLLFNKYHVEGVALADKLVGATASEYGRLAPLVFSAAQSNDKVAKDILKQSCEFIEQVVTLLAATLPPRISLIGGIAEQIISQLDQHTVLQLSEPLQTPVQGAIGFAHQQYQTFASIQGEQQ
jgi:glucosamine kinase